MKRRTRILCAILVLFSLWNPARAEQKRIALTFDDLPSAGPLGFWIPREVSLMILRALERQGIKAAGFVVEERIDDDPSTYTVLHDWASRGHILGNHTYSHVDLHQLSVRDFLLHVKDGQKYLRRACKPYRRNYRYLRFPYLHEGDTPGKKKKIAKRLRQVGYAIAPVTVLTDDLNFSQAYLELEQNPEKLAPLKAIYLEHIGTSLDYAEGQSQRVFGRNINHILWLHCGIATAGFLEDLIEMLRGRGYDFISFPEALSDPVFENKKEPLESYVGPHSLSFIDRVAATRELPFDPDHSSLSIAEIRARLED